MVRAILKEYNGTVMVISHDRYFLDEVVTKIFDLEDGEIHVYHTNYSRFVEEKEERLLQEFQAYQEQQKKIKKMKEAIKRLREWAIRRILRMKDCIREQEVWNVHWNVWRN